MNPSGGNVGIGTNEPREKLDVDGNLHVSGNLTVEGQVNIPDLFRRLEILEGRSEIGTVTDIDGNVYKTVKIGDQIWMAENLKVIHYNDGTEISGPGRLATIEDQELGGEIFTTYENWCLYDKCWGIWPGDYTYYYLDESNFQTFGALYNITTAESSKLCPSGWHVSTHEDWDVLISYWGGAEIAGGKLKSTGTEYWNSPNTGANNETVFSAYPDGYVEDQKLSGPDFFMGIYEYAYFWSLPLYPEEIPSYPYYTTIGYYLQFSSEDIMGMGWEQDPDYYQKGYCSVRCVKD